MSAISRKTYDTDSIVLRRIFAFDPITNYQVSTNSLLATATNGLATFQNGTAYLSTIGAPTSDSLLSTVTGLGTIGYLSAGTAGDVTSGQLISTVAGLGSIYLSTGGGGEVTKANLTSTTLGLGTLNYISSAQLISTVIGLSNIAVTRILAGTNVTISPPSGLGEVIINTTGGSGGSGDVTSTNLTSTTLGLGTLGYISTAQLTSTMFGLGTLNYISSAQLISTVAGLGNIYLSTSLTLLNLTSTTQGLGSLGYISSPQLISTTEGLGSLGYVSTSQLESTVANLLNTFSTVYNISSAGGVNISATTSGFFLDLTNANISTLINNNITINTSGGNVNDVDLTSTNRGLGTFGYVSSLTLRTSLQSTTNGLATLGYISSSQLTSSFTSTLTGLSNVAVTQIIAGTNITISNGQGIVTINASGSGGGGSGDVTSTNLTSTTLGLGTLGYISTASLVSTVQGLGRIGYVSSTALPSTVLGLSRFYVSTTGLGANLSSFSTSMASNFFTRTLTASTITADLLNVSTISFGTGSGFITFPFIRATYISSFSSQTDYGIVSKNLSGAQLQFSSLQGDGSQLTNISSGLYSTIVGLSNIAVTQILAGTNITISNGRGIVTINSSASGGGGSMEVTSTNLTSTTLGLGTLGYLSSSQLISTVEGLATVGYLSAPIIKLTQLLTNKIETSTLTLLNHRSLPPPPEPIPIDGFAYTLFVSSGNFYIGDGGLIGIDGLPSQSNQIITDTLLTSTSIGLGTLGYLSSTESLVNVSTLSLQTSTLTMANSVLSMSTNVTTGLNNLFVNNFAVGSYNPLRVVVSTLGDDGFTADPVNLEAQDIGKYFIFTTSAGLGGGVPNVNFPTLPDTNLDGWNVNIKNNSNSTFDLRIQTTNPILLTPGSLTKILMDATNSYTF